MRPIEAGPIVEVIQAALNPDFVYIYAGQFTGIASLGLLIFALVSAVRLASTGINLGVGQSISQVFSEMTSTVLLYMVYVFGGAAIFGLVFLLRQYLDGWAGTDTIEQTIYDLRAHVDSEREIGFWGNIADKIAKGVALPVGYASYLLFQIFAIIYVFIKQMLQVIFALVVLITYAWGFIAITTKALGGSGDLTKGFFVGIIGIFVWLFVEKLSLAILAGMFWTAGEVVQTTIPAGTMTLVIWAWFAIVAVFFAALLLLVSPIVAYFLANNQSMIAAYGGMGIAAAHTVLNAMPTTVVTDQLKSMVPDAEGDRTRDRASQSLSDFNQNPAAPAKNLLGGVADLVSSTTNKTTHSNSTENSTKNESLNRTNTNVSGAINDQEGGSLSHNMDGNLSGDEISQADTNNDHSKTNADKPSAAEGKDQNRDRTSAADARANKDFGFDGITDVPPDSSSAEPDDK